MTRTEQPAPATWPEGVLARYLTVAGAVVEVIDNETDNRPAAYSITHKVVGACTGELCRWRRETAGFTYMADMPLMEGDEFRAGVTKIQDLAQEHAETCRAMPRP